MATVTERFTLAGSKRLCWFKPLWIRPKAWPMGSASCSANGVGIMPAGVRTNRSSPNCRLSLARVLLTAGCVSPRFSATLETRRSTINCWNSTNWFRSMSDSSMNRLAWTSQRVMHHIHVILFAE